MRRAVAASPCRGSQVLALFILPQATAREAHCQADRGINLSPTLFAIDIIYNIIEGLFTENSSQAQLKVMIWRYFISYWNNRRICTANGGLPPMIKRQRYYDSLQLAA